MQHFPLPHPAFQVTLLQFWITVLGVTVVPVGSGESTLKAIVGLVGKVNPAGTVPKYQRTPVIYSPEANPKLATVIVETVVPE